MTSNQNIAIVGAGYTGLTMAYYLSKAGKTVSVYEKAAEIGGLAGTFTVEGEQLEKFYHHWFTNDAHIMNLIKDLGKEENILIRETRTGMYYAKNFFRLSSPIDLLKFSPLPFFSRIRLGFVVLAVRMVKDWKKLEDKSAKEWLLGICGKKGYEVVWEPLLTGKFGRFADKVSAVWFWNKLKLRGGSRGEKGKEFLAYYKGGFASLAQSMVDEIIKNGGSIHLNNGATKILTKDNKNTLVLEKGNEVNADKLVLTCALPQIAEILKESVNDEYLQSLKKIEYIGNTCLVLQLSKSLSETYWLNVNDPNFPFVGIIEHTNFEPVESYKGRHIVYLSKYLPTDEPLYNMTPKEVLDYALPHIKRMFPKFDESWILDFHVWKERYSQPVVVKHYSKLIPSQTTPLPDVLINTMAQIYPEDRGTNYAVREGKIMAEKILAGQF
ncbi:MAG: NAD(P)/FAD-dependent oxidoreductase [Bacteroidia bacterium]|nr:NAD(P)/FAD-dependent oxidoreductase [Bacteroidia bacterium]